MAAPLIIGPNVARALREASGGKLPPGVIVTAPFDAIDVRVRPDTVTRMRLAEQCRRMADAVRAGEVRHG